jgi:hypothetical protein
LAGAGYQLSDLLCGFDIGTEVAAGSEEAEVILVGSDVA